MIQNERQYNVTKGQISKLEGALAVAREKKGRISPRVYEAMVAGLGSQIEDLRRELAEYDRLRRARALHLRSREDLPRVLVQARVARGLTQKDLARKLHLRPQQIQKYEATAYRSASLRRILEVMRALDLDIEATIPLK